MGRSQLVVVLALVVAIAIGVGVAVAARGSSKPAGPSLVRGAGDDDANVMRALQRQKAAGAHK